MEARLPAEEAVAPVLPPRGEEMLENVSAEDLFRCLQDSIPERNAARLGDELPAKFICLAAKVNSLQGHGSAVSCDNLDCDPGLHSILLNAFSQSFDQFSDAYDKCVDNIVGFDRSLEWSLEQMENIVEDSSCLQPGLPCKCRCHAAASRPRPSDPSDSLSGIEIGVFMQPAFAALYLKHNSLQQRVYCSAEDLLKRVEKAVRQHFNLAETQRAGDKNRLAELGIHLLDHSEAANAMGSVSDVNSGWERQASKRNFVCATVFGSDFTLRGKPHLHRYVVSLCPNSSAAVWTGIVATDPFDQNKQYCFKIASMRADKNSMKEFDTKGYFSFLAYLLGRLYSEHPSTFQSYMEQSGTAAHLRGARVKDLFVSGHTIMQKRNSVADVLKKVKGDLTARQLSNQNTALGLLHPGNALFTGVACQDLQLAIHITGGGSATKTRESAKQTQHLPATRALVQIVAARSDQMVSNKRQKKLTDLMTFARNSGPHVSAEDVLKMCMEVDEHGGEDPAAQEERRARREYAGHTLRLCQTFAALDA